MVTQISRASFQAAMLAGALSILMLPGCGDDRKCESHAHAYCDEDVAYWINSCGDLEDVKEYCSCGCKSDRSGCVECECSCSEVGECCDGCVPVNEGQLCDDGDASTVNDVCQADGTCAGWSHEIVPPEAPAEPAQPEALRLRSWTCPVGWLSVEHEELLDENGDSLSWCEPPLLPRLKVEDYVTPLEEGEQEGDRPVCEPAVDGTYPVLGHATCRPLGDPCPVGEWPEIPADVTGNRIYVRAGAAGGNGSQEAPFGTIGDAVEASTSGDVVVLAAGVYAEAVTISKDLTLWGSCVQQSVIDAPGPLSGWEGGAVEITGGTEVSLRNLRVSGSQNGVFVNSSSTTVSILGVWVHKSTLQGLAVYAGEANLMQVLIDSTLPDDAGLHGWGLSIWYGAHARAESTTIERNRGVGVVASDNGTLLSLGDVAVVNTQSQEADSRFGRGMEAENEAQVTLTRVMFHGNREFGIILFDSGTQVTLEDVAVQNSRGRDTDSMFGEGLGVKTGAQAAVTRGLFEGNRDLGILAYDSGTVVSLEDVAVLNTKSQEGDLKFGWGLGAEGGARVTLTRGLFQGNREVGIFASVIGTQVSLEDVAVLNTQSQESGQISGIGLMAQREAQVTLTRGLFQGNREIAIIASNSGTLLSLEDLTVQDTQSREIDLILGRGLQAQEGAEVTLARGLFQGNRDIGVVAIDSGTFLSLEDLTVLDTHSREADLILGWGLAGQEGAQVTLSRGKIQRNREAGVAAYASGTIVSLEDVTVLDTLSREADLKFGRGVEAQAGAQLTVRRGLFQGNRDIAISAGHNGTSVSLEDITVLDTLSQESDLMSGWGLEAQQGAQVTLTRGLFRANREGGIGAFQDGTHIALNQVKVTETLMRDCASLPDTDPLSCEGLGAGIGVGSILGASISMEGVEVSDSNLAGLMLARLGSASGQGLVIRENPIGVNIQEVPDGYDFFEAFSELWIEGNQVNFDSTDLQVPDPADVIEE